MRRKGGREGGRLLQIGDMGAIEITSTDQKHAKQKKKTGGEGMN